MVKVPFALSPDKSVAFPQTADRTATWVCPSCEKEVIVKRGSILVPHFAHKVTANATCSPGESLAHRATKEWIASIVASPDFKITADCRECRQPLVAFRGRPGLDGRTEVSLGPYRIDAVATQVDGTVAAAFEIYHTHATEKVKMKTLMAKTACNAYEVKAVPDLVSAAYPTVFESIRPVKCRPCLRSEIAERKLVWEFHREKRARAYGRKWKKNADAAIRERQRKFSQRWLFLARYSTVSKRARLLHEAEESSRFQPCGTCGDPIEKFKWVKKFGSPWGYAKQQCELFQALRWNDLGPVGDIYHNGCTVPWCTECLEFKKPGEWCACERQKRRKCDDCDAWGLCEDMDSFVNPPSSKYTTSWVCKSCAVKCRICGENISQKQAKYGRACYACNRIEKRQRLGLGESEHVCDCGRRKKPEFKQCYTCWKE
jgi:hypothetical protein